MNEILASALAIKAVEDMEPLDSLAREHQLDYYLNHKGFQSQRKLAQSLRFAPGTHRLDGKSPGKPLYFEQDGLHFPEDRLPRPR
jgi:hypothetical protein